METKPMKPSHKPYNPAHDKPPEPKAEHKPEPKDEYKAPEAAPKPEPKVAAVRQDPTELLKLVLKNQALLLRAAYATASPDSFREELWLAHNAANEKVSK